MDETTPPSPLMEFTEEQRRGVAISWYRSPIAAEEYKALHQRSDAKGFIQTAGYLGILLLTGSTAFYSALHWPWWITVLITFIHGTVASFLINGVHELGHGTVFKTKWLNSFFVHILAFLGWINHEMFQSSHARHHRYTLHPPDDLEVVLPIRLMVRHFFMSALINPMHVWYASKEIIRIARGRFEGEWELTLFPPDALDKRRTPIRWARILLIGHAAIIAAALASGYWMLVILISLAPFYGSWLFFLCNNTQHVGLQDNVSDFRLCSRTFTLNPIVRFLYWQMNYHIEHHMFAAIPCYHLKRLHELIESDLPPTPNGLLAVWKEIAAIQSRQEKDPGYQHRVLLPS